MSTQPFAARGLQLRLEESQKEKIVHCNGRITAENSEMFRQNIGDLIPETGNQIAGITRRIVLDLSSVTYVDSAGLGALLGAWTAAQSKGCDLEITNLNPRVEKLVEITKLDTLFKRARIVAGIGSSVAPAIDDTAPHPLESFPQALLARNGVSPPPPPHFQHSNSPPIPP